MRLIITRNKMVHLLQLAWLRVPRQSTNRQFEGAAGVISVNRSR